MRRDLKKLNNVRKNFEAKFVRFGIRNGWVRPEKTLLFCDIVDCETGKKVTDHLWFNYTNIVAFDQFFCNTTKTVI